MNEIVLLRTHTLSPRVLQTYRQLSAARPTVLLYDADKIPALPAGINGFGFTERDLECLGVTLHREFGECIDGANNHRAIWYNPEYALLLYFLANPDDQYYWAIDYDVVFNGEWPALFDAVGEDDADLIGTKHHTTSIGWCWWNRYHLTFAVDRPYAIFFPLLRFSRRALETLLTKYREGCHGFCEVVVPTILKNLGHSIRDMNEFGEFYSMESFTHREVALPVEPDQRLYHKIVDV